MELWLVFMWFFTTPSDWESSTFIMTWNDFPSAFYLQRLLHNRLQLQQQLLIPLKVSRKIFICFQHFLLTILFSTLMKLSVNSDKNISTTIDVMFRISIVLDDCIDVNIHSWGSDEWAFCKIIFVKIGWFQIG